MVALGIALALLSAGTDAFAVVLQAGEARVAPARSGVHASLLWFLMRRRRWLAGTALMVLEWPLQVLALAFAPIAVVQPMLASSQLGLLWLARVRLGERIGRPQVLATAAIVAGLAAVVSEAPRHSSVDVPASHLIAPLAVVGGLALLAPLAGRLHARAGVAVLVGAGLAYAVVDFSNKLLANAASNGRWALVALWIVAALAFGALAFLQENTALRDRPAITVAPVIGAVKEPLPVLMAIWAGIEGWGASPLRIGVLAVGLALVVAGASALAGSRAVAQVSGGA
ncbi:MAG TPA: hypothetical protein VG223_12100 [Solirubrobacteraceae bacterium]|nr:hypothetical protein [Solirubrobacteraceae bacterium]